MSKDIPGFFQCRVSDPLLLGARVVEKEYSIFNCLMFCVIFYASFAGFKCKIYDQVLICD